MSRHRWIVLVALLGTEAHGANVSDAPSGAWVGAILEDIGRAEYEFSALDDRSYAAPNRAHGLRARIDSRGLEVTSRLHGADSTAGGWRLRLELADLQQARPDARAGRVERSRGRLREWYANDANGLEQGFEMDAPLPLEMALEGDLLAHPTEDRRAVLFETARGEAVLRLSGLTATDATGTALHARVTVESGRLRFVLEDEDAIYPLSILALLTSPIWTASGHQPGELLGGSVATAGDVNGDGSSDVIVGAAGFDSGRGQVGRALLYLGSPSGPTTTPSWIVTGDQLGEALGSTVSTAGDVNRDGYDDLLVGAVAYDNGPISRAGLVLLWNGSTEGLGPNTTPASADWRMVGDQPGQSLQAAYAGDVNGDLYDDIVIGMDGYTNGHSLEGVAFVYLGSATGLGPNGTPSNADWIVEGDQAGALMGHAVGSAGDVSRDGYDDLIVGAPEFDNGQDGEGGAFVYLGSATGLGPTGSPLNADWRREGDQPSARFGISVGLAGDVNGDGYGEILVGCDACTNGETEEGRAFLYDGSAAGPGAPVWTAESNQALSGFGASVATAGDVNGDGYADVLVGAPGYDNGQTDEGAAFVWYGSAFGLGPNGTPGNADWTAEGDRGTAALGQSVAPAGDVNGDGLGDVIVGASGYDVTPNGDQGRAWVYTGSAAGPAAQVWVDVGSQVDGNLGETVDCAGDVNGDGFSDVLVGVVRYDNGQTDEGAVFFYPGSASGLTLPATWSAEGEQAGALFGSSVASAGDVNGDGYSDVVVGASWYSVGGAPVGAAFLWYGGPTGLGPNGTPLNADWSVFGSASAQATTISGKSVASAGDVNGDGYADVVIGGGYFPVLGDGRGTASFHRGGPEGLEATPFHTVSVSDAANDTSFGFAVAGAGDVNGDGFSDVIVGYPFLSAGQGGEGSAWVFLGSPSLMTLAWHAESDQAGATLGVSVSGAGDVNGDGFGDVLVGASAYDNGQVDEGAAFVWYGGPSGLGAVGAPANADWSVESNQSGSLFGRSVSGAGDFDADGYGDVLVGARLYDNGQIDEGAAFAYRGSASGLATSPVWTGERDQAGAQLGGAVARAGDVNGDGYGDVLVGAPYYDSAAANLGLAVVHLGNDAGRDRIPRQARADGTAPIDILGRSESDTLFRLRTRGWTPAGRKSLVLEYEIKPLGYPFDGTGLGFSANIAPTCTSGGCHVDFDELPLSSGILPATHYHWRLRTSTFSPIFPRTPWISLPYNGSTETDLRTAGCRDLDGDGYGAPADAACAAGPGLDCDDSLATVHPGATELCDARDNDCDLFVDEGIPAPAGSPALTGLKLDPSVFFTWAAMPDATSYDVVRGRLSLLRSSGGDFTTTLITCWANDDAETEIEDADPPPPGDGFWYLARSVNCAGAGTYDSGAPSQAGSRDAEIDANPGSCP